METENEIELWLEETKNELSNNIDMVMKKNTSDRETLEIMKNLIQTIKVVPMDAY